MTGQCSLCALDLPDSPFHEGPHAFCCSGCLTVFQILGEVENYREHPLFQEALKVGVIANPHLVLEDAAECAETIKYHLQIEGMWCPSCAEAIRLIALRHKGIIRCTIDYATDLGVIVFDPHFLSKEEVIALIQKMGYRASEFLATDQKMVSRSLWSRFAVAAFCSLQIMMFSYPLYAAHFGIAVEGFEMTLGWLSFLLALPLLSYSSWPIWKRLILSFKSRRFGMETLIFVGVSTAFVLSTYHLIEGETTHLYFDSMSMVLTLVLLGKILERRAKFSAKETLLRLARCLPKKGFKKMVTGEFVEVPIKEIRCGDTLLIRMGEKVVLDGRILEGEGIVDEAVINGEVRPVKKQVGSQLIGGSLVKQGSFILEVTKDHDHSLLGKVVQAIEKDLSEKSVPQRLVNQITRYFVPCVLLLATFLFFSAGALRALVVLLIACPCALGIAIPLAQSRLLYLFAAKGALVRNRSALSIMAQKPLFVFDKTGTLTDGKFQLLTRLENLSTGQLGLLKGIASQSTHPICSALYTGISAPALPIDAVQEIVGRGMVAHHNGANYFLGSGRLLQEKGISTPVSEETTVYFAQNQTLLATLCFGDRLRTHIPHVDGVILSGDSPALVTKIATQCGFRWGKGNLDPLQKREEILALKQLKRPIVMVGDGVNDAAAMAAADLGISVVSATDLAIEVSDILLTTENLSALPTLCTYATKCRHIIFQNLFWAFFYNLIGIVLAAFGLLNPLLAALAMTASSLSVCLNSLRLR